MKDLNYWKNNAEEDYIQTPISVLRYITELEKNNETKQLTLTDVVKQSELLVCKGKCDHGYRDEFGNDLFCSIKEKSAN